MSNGFSSYTISYNLNKPQQIIQQNSKEMRILRITQNSSYIKQKFETKMVLFINFLRTIISLMLCMSLEQVFALKFFIEQ